MQEGSYSATATDCRPLPALVTRGPAATLQTQTSRHPEQSRTPPPPANPHPRPPPPRALNPHPAPSTPTHTCAHWMSATLPSQSTFCVDSSGRAVAQSMMALMPTRVAGREVGSVRSACRTGESRWRHVSGDASHSVRLGVPNLILLLPPASQPACCLPVGDHHSQLRRRRGLRRSCACHLTCTVVAPQSRRKSAGFCLGFTMQRTS